MATFVETQDFPEIVRTAMDIYNNLSDNYVPGEIPVFIGKDKTSLPIFLDLHEITSNEMKVFILQIINIFDSQAVALSRKKVEQLGKKKNGRIPQGKPHGRPGAS